MYYCMFCGQPMEDGDDFCANCGRPGKRKQSSNAQQTGGQQQTDFAQQPVNSQQQTNYAQQTMNNPQTNYSRQANTAQQGSGGQPRRKGFTFVSDDEQQLAVIGSGYLNSYITTGLFRKGFGILTDRRFYYRGKCYYRIGKNFMRTQRERTVDLQDVTSTGFTRTKFLSLLIGALVFFLGTVVILIAILIERSDDLTGWLPLTLVTLIPAIVCLVLYILLNRTFYEISYAGGEIAVLVAAFGERTVREFDRKLRQEKDKLRK